MADAPSSDASNRRTTSRHIACYPAMLSTGGTQALALIRDISVSGALLFLQVSQDVGTELSLDLFILPDPKQSLSAVGRIVRSSTRPPSHRGVWKYAVAVEFLKPLTDAAEAIAALAKSLPPIEVGGE